MDIYALREIQPASCAMFGSKLYINSTAFLLKLLDVRRGDVLKRVGSSRAGELVIQASHHTAISKILQKRTAVNCHKIYLRIKVEGQPSEISTKREVWLTEYHQRL